MKKDKCDDAVTYSDLKYVLFRIFLGFCIYSVLYGAYRLGKSISISELRATYDKGYVTGYGDAKYPEYYKNGKYDGCIETKDKYFPNEKDPRQNDGFCHLLKDQ